MHSPRPFLSLSASIEVVCRMNLPHDRIPPSSQCVSDQSYRVYCTVARIGYEYAIASDDYNEEREWIERSRNPAAICCDTGSGNEQKTAYCDGDI